jgi:hypothetical protein
MHAKFKDYHDMRKEKPKPICILKQQRPSSSTLQVLAMHIPTTP